MSSPPRSSQKNVSQAPPPAVDGDHRKRRRNRTTQSCLNCHATKRMCDRKRPCSRCSQLGLTGNCVYEIDDPSKNEKQNEGARLLSRIAELEGVIRELKNKPSPRWMAEVERSSASSGSLSLPPSPARTSTPPASVPVWSFPPSPRLASASSDSFSSQGASHLRNSDSVDPLLFMYDGLSTDTGRGGKCGCINESPCYHVVLELSLRLRNTTEILACSPSHSSNTTCALNARIKALDTFLKNSLLNPSSRHDYDPNFSATQLKLLSNNLDELTGDGSDAFMSWAPTSF